MPICKNCEKWYPTSEHFKYCPLCGARIDGDGDFWLEGCWVGT